MDRIKCIVFLRGLNKKEDLQPHIISDCKSFYISPKDFSKYQLKTI